MVSTSRLFMPISTINVVGLLEKKGVNSSFFGSLLLRSIFLLSVRCLTLSVSLKIECELIEELLCIRTEMYTVYVVDKIRYVGLYKLCSG